MLLKKKKLATIYIHPDFHAFLWLYSFVHFPPSTTLVFGILLVYGLISLYTSMPSNLP